MFGCNSFENMPDRCNLCDKEMYINQQNCGCDRPNHDCDCGCRQRGCCGNFMNCICNLFSCFRRPCRPEPKPDCCCKCQCCYKCCCHTPPPPPPPPPKPPKCECCVCKCCRGFGEGHGVEPFDSNENFDGYDEN